MAIFSFFLFTSRDIYMRGTETLFSVYKENEIDKLDHTLRPLLPRVSQLHGPPPPSVPLLNLSPAQYTLTTATERKEGMGGGGEVVEERTKREEATEKKKKIYIYMRVERQGKEDNVVEDDMGAVQSSCVYVCACEQVCVRHRRRHRTEAKR
jgi:hypothetical protein